MTVLFVGDIGMDTSLTLPHLPDADEKVVAEAAGDHVGGVTANAARAAHLAGASAALLCAVGSDAAGREAAERMRAGGVRVEAATVDGATCRALIMIDGDGEKRLVLVPGATMYPPPAQVLAANLTGVSWVHTAAYDLTAAALLAGRCRAEGIPWSLDLEPATIPADPAALDPVVRGAAVVFCNTRADARLGGAAADRLLAQGVGAVVLTRGAHGVRHVDRCASTDIKPAAGTPAAVDTTGAGDCLAGWFAGRTDAGDAPLAALAEAVTAATLSCARLGGQPSYPRRDEVVAATAASIVRA